MAVIILWLWYSNAEPVIGKEIFNSYFITFLRDCVHTVAALVF